MVSRRLIGTGLLLVLAVTGPALARGKWYDHYEDALAALQGGDSRRAIELLEAALARKQRSGYLRTYGNNYLRYVPHFYLGVAWHDAGDCRRSLDSFALSDAAEETAEEPALAARLQVLRTACEQRLAPPPEPPRLVAEEGIKAAPAEEAAPPAAKPDPSRPVLDAEMLEEGLGAYLAGDLDRAIRAFEKLTRSAPESARVRLLLGMALHGAWAAGGERDRDLLQRSRRELAEAARLDPRLVPDPALCPPRVVALYRSVR